MNHKEVEAWIDSILPKHKTLTNTVISIVESLLERHGIDYLAVSIYHQIIIKKQATINDQNGVAAK